MDKKEIEYVSGLRHKDWCKIGKKYYKPAGTPLDQEAALKDLKDIKKVLDEVGVKFWLFHGTLLGAIRNDDWIPWDDDVDICVMEEDLLPKLKEIRKRFMDLGFIARDPEKTAGTKLNLYRYNQKNSIDGLFLDPTYKNNKYRLSRTIRYPRTFFEKEQTIEFKETIFNVPSPPEEFLSWTYGKWKKPIKSDRPNHERVNSKKIYYKHKRKKH